MYGLWYITFGCLAWGIVGLILGTIFKKLARYYLRRYKETYHEYNKYDSIADPDYKIRTPLGVEYRKYDLLHDKYDDKDCIGWAISILMAAAVMVLIPFSIFEPLNAQREANYFISQKEYVEMAVNNGEGLENIAITQTIIEQNKWLANAKASKATYGTFSRYYNVDFDSLEPITVRQVDDGV